MNAPLSQRFPQPSQRLRWLGIGLGVVTVLAEGGFISLLLLATQSLESIAPFFLPIVGSIFGIIAMILWLQFAPGSLRAQWEISLHDGVGSPGQRNFVMTTEEPSLPSGTHTHNENLPVSSYPSQLESRTFVLPKEGDDPERCDDKHAKNTSTPQQRYAVADGVSASFLPGRWAQIIAASFVMQERDFANPDEFIQWLTACSHQWHTWVQGEWIPEANKIRQSRYDWERDRLRGAQTTFVGCSFSAQALLLQRETNVYVTSVGDANFFLAHPPVNSHDRWQYSTFPQEHPSDFGLTPDTLGTAEPYLRNAWKDVKTHTYRAIAGDIIILATDALAHWILTRTDRGDSPWPDLLAITDHNTFRHFVEQERRTGQMEVDDTTLMVIFLK